MLSMLLAFSLVLSIAPFGYASGLDELMIVEELPVEEQTQEQPVDATITVEETEAAAEETEAVVPETVPAATEPAEEVTEATAPEQTEAEETQPEETEAEETEPEETEPEQLEDIVLTEAQLEEKRALSGEAEALAALIPGEDYVADEVIFMAEDAAYARTVAQAYGGSLKSCEYGVAVIALQGMTVAEAMVMAADLTNNLPAVYPNYITQVEPVDSGTVRASAYVPRAQEWEDWVRGWMDNPDPFLRDPASSQFQWMHDMVNTYQAWGVTTGIPAVKVAVVDSGVQANHPDLNGKVTSYDIGLGTSDAYGHGTHVAGIIAASMDNGIGGAGIAPGVSIMNIRVLNAQGSGTDANIARGIRAAADNGAWIINLSLGGPRYNSVEEQAVAYAVSRGVTVVAAMGNNGSNTIYYPAAYNFNGVVSVVAVDKAASRAWFSNYGKWADVAAPGESILSCVPGSGYDLDSGTSMAAPVVSGVAALYMSAYGKVSPAEMEQLLRKNTSKGNTNDLGTGIVDAAKLFGAKKMDLAYQITDEYGNVLYLNNYKNAKVPCESTLRFGSLNVENDDTSVILYTLDGKNPTVKDGQVVNGQFYDWGTGIDLSSYSGKSVTVKASYISGMGIVSKPISLKINVAASQKVSSVTIDGPDTLVAGKKGTYTAAVLPAKAEQGVNWYIYSRTGQNKASINAKGVLTTEANSSGRITIRAISKADPSKYRDFTVNVQTYNPVKTITLNYDKYTLNVGQQFTLGVQAMVDTTNMIIPSDRFDVEWSTSSAKIATVDAKTGRVTAIGKGTATITCKALDGSGKTAKCKVTVNVPVEDIVITGQHIVEPGKSVNYKATVYPTTANNKKVTWLLHDAPYGVTISTSGMVKVPQTARTGVEFTVLALAQDGSGVVGSMECRIENKCKSLSVSYAGSAGRSRAKINNKGEVTALTLFSTKRTNGLYVDNGITTDISAPLDLHFTGSNYPVFQCSSSKPEVADVFVDRSTNLPVVVGLSKGTAKITFSTTDGSNKKAVVTVNVINPVSTMSIQTNANRIDYNDSGRDGIPIIAFGKSANHKVVFADTYGVPGNQKVTWDFTVKEYSWNTGRFVKDWTSEIRAKKLVTISNSGSLSVKAGMKNFWYGISGEIRIAVTATAQDGTGQTATLEYYAIPQTTYLKIDKARTLTCVDPANGIYALYFQCDQRKYFADPTVCAFTATSSNPQLIGVRSIEPAYDRGDDWYTCYLVLSKNSTSGNAKITIKSADGAKSDSYSLTVKTR